MTKPTKWHVRPGKTQISLGIRPVWSVFAVCMKKAWILSYPLSAQRRLWSDWVDAQADLCLCWAQSFYWFCHETAHLQSLWYKPILGSQDSLLSWSCSVFLFSLLSSFSLLSDDELHSLVPALQKHKKLAETCSVKFLKIQTPEKFAVIILKFEQRGFQLRNVSKRCRRNSKQCRPWSECSSRSSLIWVYTVCPDLSVRKLRNNTVILWTSIIVFTNFKHIG